MKNKGHLMARWGLLSAAVVLTAIGIGKKEYLEVMQKAVRICLECIGIG